ncbi:helix-turn-helix domain-containing protein [Serratia grimesii]|jgi:transcriptional regulator with XRE-family HTH domain|uniref:DNA-binding protein n=1 Tax=Serratia grimesii TaxID=82995 RepID=A0ABR4UA54_9GAMM|nr:helix-turn-helix domain-containing protein [Serratia grimesii]KFB88910.1 DNA-binding protein [Serratia grimesii]CAI0745000.1 anaerobic benzoate catabolism transcriptional regulator [Serratia grimesii]CAI0915271.1 anaerobic benzoate catabolism transcriptional regulator [Serratia grimesii]CAI2449418.1 anaerobic benzoate catabolism transcriptional regulator [Serratia grimesii]SUI32513.1 anaerobic benzoate catabolism transcriptional regulator [Serratia grimesii]
MQTYRIRQLRLDKGWSQEQLATIAGLSTRTVQRIENGEQASLETLTAIAAALGVQVSDLYQPIPAQDENQGETEQTIRRQVEAEAKLLSMAVRFALIGLMLFAINWFTHPQYLWSLWAIGGMSFAILMRAMRTLLLRDALSRWQQQRLAQKLRRMP